MPDYSSPSPVFLPLSPSLARTLWWALRTGSTWGELTSTLGQGDHPGFHSRSHPTGLCFQHVQRGFLALHHSEPRLVFIPRSWQPAGKSGAGPREKQEAGEQTREGKRAGSFPLSGVCSRSHISYLHGFFPCVWFNILKGIPGRTWQQTTQALNLF